MENWVEVEVYEGGDGHGEEDWEEELAEEKSEGHLGGGLFPNLLYHSFERELVIRYISLYKRASGRVFVVCFDFFDFLRCEPNNLIYPYFSSRNSRLAWPSKQRQQEDKN